MTEPESDKTTYAATQKQSGGPPSTSAKTLPRDVAEAAADPAKRVGKYVTVKPLGAGGMGVVVKAYDTELHRWAALKFLKATGDDDARAYFLREAQVAAKLSHPNIAAIYEVGEQGGQPFIAMQYVDGDNLHVARKKMTLVQAVDAMRKVADALKHAHEQRIIHRDLKPANIMIDAEGRVFVMDFGLAKETAVDGQSVAGSGAIVGTPSYMSPEQAKGKADAQSDVYGLGATLYDLITHRAPFTGETAADILTQIATQDPVTPRKLNPAVPADLEAITLRALERDRSRRYPSVYELISDLEAFRAGDPLKHARRLTWGYVLRKRIRRQPLLWGLGAALLIAIVAGTAVGAYGLVKAAREAEDRAKAEREGRENTEAQRAKAEERLATHYATLGGRAFEEGDAATAALYFAEASVAHPTRALRASAAAALEGPVRLRAIIPGAARPPLLLSPDGKRLFCHHDQRAELWSAETGSSIRIVGFPKPIYDACLSPDGRRVAVAFGDPTVQILDAESTLEAVASCKHGANVRWIRYGRNGTRVITAGVDKKVRIWDAEKGESVGDPVAFPAVISSIVVSPDTLTLAVGLADGTISRLSLEDPTSPAKVEKFPGVRINLLAYSPDGQWMVASQGHPRVMVWEVAKGASTARVLVQESGVQDAAFSRTGERLVVACDSGAVMTWSTLSGEPTGLLTHPDSIPMIVMHPKLQMPLTACHDGNARIWTMPAGKPAAVVVPHEREAALLALSAEGDRFAVGSGNSTTTRIWDLDISWGENRILQGDCDLHEAIVSPDGRWIAGRGPGSRVVIWRSGSTTPERMLEGPKETRCAKFSSNGGRIVAGGRDGIGRQWDVATGAQVGADMQLPGPWSVLVYADDGRSILGLGPEGSGRFDAETGAPVGPSLEGLRARDPERVMRGGRWVATDGGDEKTVAVWDTITGKPLHAGVVHDGAVDLVSCSADGSLMITHVDGGKGAAWDPATGRSSATRIEFPDRFDGVKYSPDGTKIALSSRAPDDSLLIRMWDLRTGAPVGKWMHFGKDASVSGYSPDSAWLISSDEDQVTLWDAGSGEPVRLPRRRGIAYNRSEMSPDCAFMTAVGRDKRARLFELPYLARPSDPARLVLQSRAACGRKIDEEGVLVFMTPAEWAETKAKLAK